MLHQPADVSLASFPFRVHLVTVAGSCFDSALIVFGIIEHLSVFRHCHRSLGNAETITDFNEKSGNARINAAEIQ